LAKTENGKNYTAG